MNAVRNNIPLERAQLLQNALIPANPRLPPIVPSDYNLPLSLEGDVHGGRRAYLIGGNAPGRLPPVPADGFYDLGIVASGESSFSEAGLDIVTSNVDRVRIHGEETNEEPQFQAGMEGRTVISNGMIAQEELPASAFFIGNGLLPPGIGFVDIYLERPSNVYSLTVSDTTLAPASFPTFSTDFPGYAPLTIGNMFVGERPINAPSSVTGYNAASVTPAAPLELGIDTYNFLLKIVRPVFGIGTLPLAVFFGEAGAQQVNTVSPTLNVAPYLIPAGGAGFFEFRVENGSTFTMLSNVIYNIYTDPIA